MALIKCPECGKEISDEAEVCIHCGYPLKNKQVVESDQNNKKQPESHVIAYRCGPGGTVISLTVIGIIFGLLMTAAYIILGIYYGETIWLGMSFFALFAIILDVGSIFLLIKVGMNASNKHNCIEYDANNCKFILNTLWGKEIAINPSDYVELKDNFFTDNMLMFTYRLSSGRLKKVNLGSCSDRDGLRARINKVIEKIEK